MLKVTTGNLKKNIFDNSAPNLATSTWSTSSASQKRYTTIVLEIQVIPKVPATVTVVVEDNIGLRLGGTVPCVD